MYWPDLQMPPINLWNVPKRGKPMTIVSATVTKGKSYPRNKELIAFFEDKGLYRNTDEFKQFTKLEEETDELLEALQYKSKQDILLEAGDCYVCLLNILKCCDLTMEDAVNAVTEKVVKRKGKIVQGMFVKEV